jgi:hypothetical protein
VTFTRAAIAIAAVAALVLLLFILFDIGPFADASPSPSPSASPSASASPTESASPTASEASAGPTVSLPPTDEEWTCGEPITMAATGTEIVHTADVRIGTHDGYDRIVFEYLEDGSPDVDVREAVPPFTQDASGNPMTVNGDPVFQITLSGATKMADDGSSTYTGATDFEPDFPMLIHLTERGDFEAVNSWYAGLNGGDCLRVAVLTDPSRVVVDVQH